VLMLARWLWAGSAAVAAALASPACLDLGGSDDDPKPKDAGAQETGTLTDGSWACTPKTCKSLNADCGDTSDGCGKVIQCGSCAAGETCGAAGPDRCGKGTCTPATCAGAGAECGLIGDGCGNTLSCGSCAAPKVCGASGQANTCGCVPATCAALGKDCGTVSDGCGGTLDCGKCPTGKTCGANVANVCACVPTTCAAEGKNCGSLPDGCGNTLSCGSCIAPSTCGALGTPNVCGCTPQNCPPVYQNGFESVGDFGSDWLSWHNCNADAAWSVTRGPYASAGAFGLRLKSTGFTSSCQYPGCYTVTPKVPALPLRVYKVSVSTRVGPNQGATTLLFLDAAGAEIGAEFAQWPKDSGQFKANPVLSGTSPAGTAALRVRLELWTTTTTADVDQLQVDLVPL